MEGITLLGCRENNLKNIDITIPYGKIVAFIGVSGSGKSTIAFDTLYAEGKRRYIESLGINESFFLSKVKNFTLAAEQLSVAQSTVTNRISELEKEVGKKLFSRGGVTRHEKGGRAITALAIAFFICVNLMLVALIMKKLL